MKPTSMMEVVGLSAVLVGAWLISPWLLLMLAGGLLMFGGWWFGR